MTHERLRELHAKYGLNARPKTQEEKAKERAEYLDACRRRAEELDAGGSEPDIRSRMRHAGVPHGLIGPGVSPKPTMALGGAAKFLAEPRALLFAMLGPPGTGKSVAAAYVLADFARRFPWGSQPTGAPPPCLWVPASALTQVSAFNSDDAEWLARFRRCDLLVIDDLGDEATEVGKAALVEIIQTRHAKQRRTVMTANLRPDAMRSRYGEQLTDRIRESPVESMSLWGQGSMRGAR